MVAGESQANPTVGAGIDVTYMKDATCVVLDGGHVLLTMGADREIVGGGDFIESKLFDRWREHGQAPIFIDVVRAFLCVEFLSVATDQVPCLRLKICLG